MIPVLLRIRQRPRSDLVNGVHITGTPYASRQVMKGNNFGAISFDNVPVAADDVMSAFVSVDAAAPPSCRFVLAKGALQPNPSSCFQFRNPFILCKRRHSSRVSRALAESPHCRSSVVPSSWHGDEDDDHTSKQTITTPIFIINNHYNQP